MNPYSDRHSEHPLTDDEFEAALRAKLQRLAADLELQQPSWDDLRQRAGGIVVSLRTGQPIGGTPRRGRFPGWVRPALAAAACLALVMTAGILIGRSTTSTDGSDSAETADAADESAGEMASVSEDDFPVGRAEILYPDATESELQSRLVAEDEFPEELTWMQQPTEAAERYLATAGFLPADSSYVMRTEVPEDGGLVMREGADGNFVDIANVWWTLREPVIPEGRVDQPVITQGRVLLRNLRDPGEEPAAWAVVGVRTMDLDLTQVGRLGDTVVFTVGVAPRVDAYRDMTNVPVQVSVNGLLVAEGVYTTPTTVTAMVPAAEPATIRLQQVDDGEPLSLTENTFPPATEQPATEVIDPSALPRVRTGVQQFVLSDPDCANPGDLMLSLEIPLQFSIEPGVAVADSQYLSPSTPCAQSTTFVDGRGNQIIVGTGEPSETLTESSGPACFRWGEIGEGFMAQRTRPEAIWLIGFGMTADEFASIVETSLLEGEETWTADTGC